MSWLDLVGNRTFLAKLFGDEAPSLETVEVHEIILHRDGPRLTIRFDLADFPESPPSKWADEGCNTLQVTLMIIGTGDLQLTGWAANVTAQLVIGTATDGRRQVGLSNGAVSLNVTADFVRIDKVSAYRNEKSERSRDRVTAPRDADRISRR